MPLPAPAPGLVLIADPRHHLERDEVEIANQSRILATLLREICAEQGIRVRSFSGDWIFRLQAGDRSSLVFGYDFALNAATAQMIGDDKAAAAELLADAGVPAVEHRLFHSPQMAAYVPSAGNWSAMLGYFHQHGGDVVCKPNDGTGGRDVSRVRTAPELEAAVHRIFARNRSLCLSPFLPIDAEYRVYVFRGRAHIVYAKERPAAVGDGRSTLLEMVLADPALAIALAARQSGSGEARAAELELSRVPAAGETVLLNWRHNLGQGGRPRVVLDTDPAYPPLSALALSAARALGIELAAVDVVDSGGELRVLEVNCGIMMESFARSGPENRERAKRFYHWVVAAAVGLPEPVGG
jgi:glutathione synthase/RimK-type ligase-like ATP-grasp enzyme